MVLMSHFLLFALLLSGQTITSSNYDTEVVESKTPVVLEVYSNYCHACQTMIPIFSELSHTFAGQVKFAKLNIDKEGGLADELSIRAMPTFLFIKNGQIVNRHVGTISKENLSHKIDALLLPKLSGPNPAR